MKYFNLIGVDVEQSDREAVQLLVNDFVMLADQCKQALNKAHFKGEDTEQASVALYLCEQVLERWTTKKT